MEYYHRDRANTMLEALFVTAATPKQHGRIIEDGWQALKDTILNGTESDEVKSRQLFFCGALHLWTTISTMIGQAGDEKAKDLTLAAIHAELIAFVEEVAAGNPSNQRETH